MRAFSILFFILISVCLGAAANTEKSKYERLASMQINGVVNVNDDQYMDLILRGNRDYDAFLLYTTVGNRYHCTLCPATNREFAMVANAYSKLEEKAEKNVLFIRISIDSAPKVFQYHNIQTAPILTFLSSSDVLGKKLNTNNDYQVEYPVRAENIASYVRSKIHVLISIYRFPWPQVIIACLFVFGLPLAAYIYLFHYKKVYDWLGNYRIYLVISLLIYGIAITGVVYDIIHGPPFMNCNQYGCSLFMNQQNQQSIAEGLFTGCFLIGCAYCSIQLIENSRTKPDSIYQNIILFGICFCLYFFFFCARTPWYPQVFTYKG